MLLSAHIRSQVSFHRPAAHSVLLTLLIGLTLLTPAASFATPTTFENAADHDEMGLAYQRVRSASDAIFQDLKQRPTYNFTDIGITPLKSRGMPGLALLDFDGDDDLDVYVTNGPGADNSLFANQLADTGSLSFVDVAVQAGVAANDHDGSGVCFGDTDNDGDHDLLVLSAFAENRFFENQGDGTFAEITAASGLGEDVRSSNSCSFGDIDGDGLLDVVVANTVTDHSNMLGIVADPFAFNQHNQLYRNEGGNTFANVSQSAGIENLRGFPPGLEGQPGLTWAIAMVDVDLDGDVDIVTADDQAGIPMAKYGGIDRGLLHLFRNDGTGTFVDEVVEAGLNTPGQWMGLNFGDLDGNGTLDFFATNVGDYATTTISPVDPQYGAIAPYELGDSTSRWFLGNGDGTFEDPGVGALVATPFGWGVALPDFDNDGDLDVVYHGSLDAGPVVHLDNPGVLLANDGTGQFTWYPEPLANSADHLLRNGQGVAIGDLDGNGFTDIVSVSNFDTRTDTPVFGFNVQWGSPFDGQLGYSATFRPTEEPGVLLFTDVEYEDGSLAVELASDNGNRWAKVRLMGTHGLTTGGRVNRDGIGAVVEVVTTRGVRTMRPILGGASYASQDSLEHTFGMGGARRMQVDVLWPGGTRNRIYGVRDGERLHVPEIPCSYDADWPSFGTYAACVQGALHELRDAGILGWRDRVRLALSAYIAFFEER